MDEESPILPSEEESDQRVRTPTDELLAFMRTERWIMLVLMLGVTGATIYFLVQMSKRLNAAPALAPVNGLNGLNGYGGYFPLPPIQIINHPPPYNQGGQRNQTNRYIAPPSNEGKSADVYCDRCDRQPCQCY